MRLLHLAKGEPHGPLWVESFVRSLRDIGGLDIVAGAGAFDPAERLRRIRECDVLLTGWGSCPVPAAVAADPGRLRYICHLTGTVRGTIPEEVIRSGIPVTNWGDAPALGMAEGALTLLLATLKNLHWQIRATEEGERLPPAEVCATMGGLHDLRLGIYGAGMIGLRFIELCRPFRPRMRLFDPFLEVVPDGVGRAEDLRSLFAASDAIVIHAGLTEATRQSVNAGLLALLPDGGVIVNTARGDIIDQDALFAELAAGRLRAGLDVLARNDLQPSADSPARRWPNLILTGHKVGNCNWAPRPDDAGRMRALHEVALDNLRRFQAGGALRFVMDLERFLRST